MLNDNYWTKIKELKGKYYGAQDEYFMNNFTDKNEKLSYHKTIKIEANGSIGPNKSCSFPFPKLECDKFVYKNLRFTSNNYDNIINKCTLECNGSNIDTIYGRVFKTLRHIYNIENDTFIPFYFCTGNEYLPKNDSCKVYIRFEPFTNIVNDFSLSVDIYEIIDDNFEQNSYDKIVSFCQHTGCETMKTNPTFRLDFNHVINHIIVSVPNGNPKNISLLFDNDVVCFPTEEIDFYDNHYIIPFTPSLNKENINNYGINYSRVDSPKITIEIDNNTNCECCYIYGVYWNCICMRNNLIGLHFSK